MSTGTNQTICIVCGETYNTDCEHTCKGPNIKRVEFHFDERSLATEEEVQEEGRVIPPDIHTIITNLDQMRGLLDKEQESSTQTINRLRLRNKQLLDALLLVYDLYNLPIGKFKHNHPEEYPLACEDEAQIWAIVRRVIFSKAEE